MRELVLTCGLDLVEPLSDALFDAGALSVSVEDADHDTPDEQPIFGEPGDTPAPGWQSSRIIVLLPDHIQSQQEASNFLEDAAKSVSIETSLDFLLRTVPDEDWVRLTQSQFEPILITNRIQIVPTWHEIPENAGDILIRLDPGLAFGTGSHPTTRLCLQWLEENVKNGCSLLDYGCGSGILAIAAYKLGARDVVGIDIDPQAVVSSQQNAQLNQLPPEVRWGLPDDCPETELDIVVANILSQPLKMLAPMLVGRLKLGGQIALSGILERQIDEVTLAYQPYIQLQAWKTADGWVCLHGTRQC